MAENAVQTEQEQPKAADSLLDMVTKQVGKRCFRLPISDLVEIHGCNEVVLNFASSSLVPLRDLRWQLSIPFSFQLFDLSQLSGRLSFEISLFPPCCCHNFSRIRSHMDGGQ